jgi:SAM-dependent methyltransferase
MTTERSWITRLRRRWRKASAPRARTLPGVPGRVHVDDSMLYDESEQAVADYLRAASSAVDNIDKALRASGKTFADVGTCLDFGCGYGRVLRLLREKIPSARITASDVVEDGVRFCAEELGARPLVSSWDVGEVRLGIYDLIWSGSVFTHLDEASCETLFGKLARSLMPGGGVLVFSIHGQHSLDGLGTFYGQAYAEEAETIRREVAQRGICFRPYTDPRYGRFPVPYGMTWHRREYFERLAAERFGDRLRLTLWEAHGWDLHHDVLAFERTH